MKALLPAALLAALALQPAAAAAQVVSGTVVRSGTLSCGWLGINFDRAGGVMAVRSVENPSPAQRAGVVAGDTVLRINGAAAARDGFVRAPIINPGDTVRMTLRRAQRERDVRIVAEPRPGGCALQSIVIDADSMRRLMRVYIDSSLAILDTLRLPRIHIERGDQGHLFLRRPDGRVDTLRMFHGELTDSALARVHGSLREREGQPLTFHWVDVGARAIAGAEFSELTPELAAGLRLDTRTGLLVLKVAPGTPAARAGLEAGDVIVRARGQSVHSISELRAAVAAQRDQPVPLEVLRQGQRRTLTLPR
jgi:predicted metalloprotease with PDZ domain